jgi:hypothetical protein
MRKFVITSSKFKGQAELVYNDSELLTVIDLQQAFMDMETIYRFKAVAPLTIKQLQTGSAFSNETTVVEVDFTVSFDMFWQKYDKKINRKRCEPLWEKLPKGKQVTAWAGIDAYNRFLQLNSWRKKADPETYLRNEMWDNEWK